MLNRQNIMPQVIAKPCLLTIALFLQLQAHADTGYNLESMDNYKRQAAILEKNAAVGRKTLAIVLNKEPSDLLTREKLGILYNNMGVSAKENPKAALALFELTNYLLPGNSIAEKNRTETIRRLGMNPTKFEDVVKLGDEALAQENFEGAIVEYRQALKIKNDGGLEKKLAAVPPPKILPVYDDRPLNPDKLLALQWIELPEGVSYAPFLDSVQNKVIEKWKAPPSLVKGSVTVRFDVDMQGKISNARITQRQPANIDFDKSALDTIKKIQSVDKPPPQGPFPLPVEFEFSKRLEKGEYAASIARIDYAPFMANLKPCLKKAWSPPKRSERQTRSVTFQVDRNGKASNVKLDGDSKDKELEDSCILAVQTAQLPKPPSGSRKLVNVLFVFDYFPDSK